MIDEFLTLFERNDPKSLKSIQHAREVSPELFDAVGRRILTTLSQTFPERSLGDFAQTYSFYTFEQNRLQARYERTGKYPFANHAKGRVLHSRTCRVRLCARHCPAGH